MGDSSWQPSGDLPRFSGERVTVTRRLSTLSTERFRACAALAVLGLAQSGISSSDMLRDKAEWWRAGKLQIELLVAC